MPAELRFIGHIETPFMRLEDCPRNIDPNGPACRLIISLDYADGLLGLTAGQEIVILYWFEDVDRSKLRQHSRKTGEYAGTFALRSPHRPNPLGMAVVTIEAIEEGAIRVRGLDCLNGTPLVDIKPAILRETGNCGAEEE